MECRCGLRCRCWEIKCNQQPIIKHCTCLTSSRVDKPLGAPQGAVIGISHDAKPGPMRGFWAHPGLRLLQRLPPNELEKHVDSPHSQCRRIDGNPLQNDRREHFRGVSKRHWQDCITLYCILIECEAGLVYLHAVVGGHVTIIAGKK
jgi:hypothetical protein